MSTSLPAPAEGDFIEDLLLADFADVLGKEAQPLFDNAEYMRLYELRVLLKLIREQTSNQLFQAYSRPDTINVTTNSSTASSAAGVEGASSAAPAKGGVKAKASSVSASAIVSTSTEPTPASVTVDSLQRCRTDRQLLSNRLRQLDQALQRHDAYVQARLALCGTSTATTTSSSSSSSSGRGSNNKSNIKPISQPSTRGRPRILQLCDGYHFSPGEMQLFQLMVVVQGSCNPHCLNALTEDNGDYMRRVSNLMRLSGNSDVSIDIFCDPERAHIREGLVTLDEDNGIHFNLKVPRTAVQLLYGRSVKRDDLLKVSSTLLEEILLDEREVAGITSSDASTPVSATKKGKRRRTESDGDKSKDKEEPDHRKSEGKGTDEMDEEGDMDADHEDDGDDVDTNGGEEDDELDPGSANKGKHPRLPAGPALARSLSITSTSGRLGAISSLRSPRTLSGAYPGGALVRTSSGSGAIPAGMQSLVEGRLKSLLTGIECGLPLDTLLDGQDEILGLESPSRDMQLARKSRDSLLNASGIVNADDQETKTYPSDNQLEYLEECFQLVALMIRGNAARLKDDLKKEGTRVNNWDAGDVKHGKRELQAKLRLQEGRVERRVEKTKEAGLPLPRLEILAERLHLDAFERKMILLLIGKTVSPVVKTLMETLDGSSRVVDEAISVGQALGILCQDFQTQVANRKYFYRSGRLMSNGIISLSRSRWHQGGADLTDNRIVLDRRVLDWTVGLDSEINELVEGSDLYEPKVSLNQVVLPPGHMETLCGQCKAYDNFRKYRISQGLTETLPYGNSLVIMLCGKSGTGKTMSVNAIAKELGKKVLMVDFASLSGRKGEGNDTDADLRGLFREAQMNNAVLFFDECETVFRARGGGGDRLLNSLLTEIERHEGIVFLATNRPYDLDEAMHRRITVVLEYRAPDSAMRRSIWHNLLGTATEQVSSPSSASGESSDVEGSNNDDSAPPAKASKTSSDATARGSGSSSSSSNSSSSSSSSSSSATKTRLQIAPDVDIAALAARYELTGGFIKNAVLSALLTAIGRSSDTPIITQSDLLAGCKLQMRGSLTRHGMEEKVVPSGGVDDLDLEKAMRDAMLSIVRFEKARSTIYGTWQNGHNTTLSHPHDTSQSHTNLSASQPSSLASLATSARSITQKATICCLAGPSGSGKKSYMKALSWELGRVINMIHVTDLISTSIHDAMARLQALVADARLADGMVCIDGFEHIMEDSMSHGGEGTWKLHLLLSRCLAVLHAFPGLVVLLCHIDSPQNVTLQRDFASKLYCFLRFAVPSAGVRTKLWRRLMPPHAPLAPDVTFDTLGRRFELHPQGIAAAISRACGEALAHAHSLPPSATTTTITTTTTATATATATAPAPTAPAVAVTLKHLLSAGEAEVQKLKVGGFDMIGNGLFV